MLTVLTVVHDAVLSEDAGILRGPEIWLGFARNDFSLMIRVPAGLTTKGHFNSGTPGGRGGSRPLGEILASLHLSETIGSDPAPHGPLAAMMSRMRAATGSASTSPRWRTSGLPL